jgi:hypothetical protein
MPLWQNAPVAVPARHAEVQRRGLTSRLNGRLLEGQSALSSMTSTNGMLLFCRFCGGPPPETGTVQLDDGNGHLLTFCDQFCCDQFKAKATRPDSPRSKGKRLAPRPGER